MPSRKTTKVAEAAAAKLPTIPEELIDQFVTGLMSPEAVEAASMAFLAEQYGTEVNPEFSARSPTL
jgi:hypothetical protein